MLPPRKFKQTQLSEYPTPPTTLKDSHQAPADRMIILPFSFGASGQTLHLYHIELRIEDFVALRLCYLPANQRQRAVELFAAESMPWGLILDEQRELGEFFASCLHRNKLAKDLVHVFHDNLPPATHIIHPIVEDLSEAEIAAEDENEGWSDDDDSLVDDALDHITAATNEIHLGAGNPSARDHISAASHLLDRVLDGQDKNVNVSDDKEPAILPSWFSDREFCLRCCPEQQYRQFDEDVQGSAQLNQILDLASDLRELIQVLENFDDKLWCRIRLIQLLKPGGRISKMSSDALELLGKNSVDGVLAKMLLINSHRPEHLENASAIRQRFEKVENFLLPIKQRLLNVESYLACNDARLTEEEYEDWGSLHAAFRNHLGGIISHLRTPRLQTTYLPQASQVQLTTREHKEEDCCSICYADFAPRRETEPPLAVTYKCCQRVFHTACLLTWLLTQPKDISCPLCRHPVGLDHLRELMEMQLRDDQESQQVLDLQV